MRRLWIVAAGTGGHIVPGITLAKTFLEYDPQTEVLFFGTSDRLEAKLIPQAGFPIAFLKAGRWKGMGLFSRLLGLFYLVIGFFQVLLRLLKGPRPTLLIGVGGYVSLPVALASLLFRVPLFIIEPNIRAGISNRFLSRFAKMAFSVPGGDANNVFKCPVENVGTPTRSEITKAEPRESIKNVLVLGGSQGAWSLCKLSLHLLEKFRTQGFPFHLTVQSGQGNLVEAQKLQKSLQLEKHSSVVPFIDNVPEILKTVDLIIARAGAMTVAELSLSGITTLFIPFPFAADDHQRINAKIIADDHAAFMIDERDADYEKRVLELVTKLVNGTISFEERRQMSLRFQGWGRPQASQTIVSRILERVGNQ